MNRKKIIGVGLLTGFLLNLFGWLGNNLLLGGMWREVGESLPVTAWQISIWKDVFSFLPDYLYGFAIAWLCVKLRDKYPIVISASIRAGLYVSLVGGITTYFAIANSGFIPWKLALFSFVLVLGTKLPLAVLAGHLLYPTKKIS